MIGGALQRVVARLAEEVRQHRVVAAAVSSFAQREIRLPGGREHRVNRDIATVETAFGLTQPAAVNVRVFHQIHFKPTAAAVKHHVESFLRQIRIERIGELRLVLVFHQHRQRILNGNAVAKDALIAKVAVLVFGIQIKRFKRRALLHVQRERIVFRRRIAMGARVKVRNAALFGVFTPIKTQRAFGVNPLRVAAEPEIH